MVRALASKQCGPGWNSAWYSMGVELVVNCRLALRVFFPVTPVSLPSGKPTFSNSNGNQWELMKENATGAKPEKAYARLGHDLGLVHWIGEENCLLPFKQSAYDFVSKFNNNTPIGSHKML